MKLIKFKHQENYIFILTFENGETIEANLKSLIEKHVSLSDLSTAQLNKEWGCLEFNNGMVDIEPKTLYRYAIQQSTMNEFAVMKFA
jgi:hypothetical protein